MQSVVDYDNELDGERHERRSGGSTYRPRRLSHKTRTRARRSNANSYKGGVHERGNNRWSW